MYKKEYIKRDSLYKKESDEALTDFELEGPWENRTNIQSSVCTFTHSYYAVMKTVPQNFITKTSTRSSPTKDIHALFAEEFW